MAGGHYHPVKHDPAIERWAEMHNTMYQRFRMTKAATRFTALWVFAIPIGTYYLADYTTSRWNLNGTLRGESLLRNPPAKKEEESE